MFHCAIAADADPRPRADRVHHAGGQRARRSRPRVSAGHLAPARNARQRDWVHQRLALVRRCRRRVARLGLLAVSLGTDSKPGSGDHVFGGIVLGCPLSRATVVPESTGLEQLGIAGVPAAATASAPAASCFASANARGTTAHRTTARQAAASHSRHRPAARWTAARPGRQQAAKWTTAFRRAALRGAAATRNAIARPSDGSYNQRNGTRRSRIRRIPGGAG